MKNKMIWVVLILALIAVNFRCAYFEHRLNQLERIEQARWEGINTVTPNLINSTENKEQVNYFLFKKMREIQDSTSIK